ncbi:MAG: WD40/YVTN/BNR-like repeat-containing protein [Gemmatimonadota bacterium]
MSRAPSAPASRTGRGHPAGHPGSIEHVPTRRRRRLAAAIPLALGLLAGPGALLPASAQAGDATPEPALLDALEYRMIGPYRGGRVTAVDGVPGSPMTFYMGSTGGGVWRTDDAGESWSNVSDEYFDVASIGAVEVADADASVVYVGTGSACIRGNISTGRGVYRSRDGGRTWAFAGLPEAGLIGNVVTDPRDPDVVFVAALGHPFGRNPERGVYRSRDGGDSWEQVLFVSDSTGAVDLVIDPVNPRIVYAAMWRAERKPWTLIDGAEEGGIYRSRDGGDTWEKLTNGLPDGPVGRIGLSLSASRPDRVWALVTAEPGGGVFRSDDGGDSWTRTSADRDLRGRGWYYAHITADPTDPNTVYVENAGFFRSIDGGQTFDRVPVPHGDVHDLWINPDDPEVMVVANDGGAQVSLTGGRTWSTMHNQPTAEMYRVEVDNQWPYRVYGAQQDNSTISVPSASVGALTPEGEWYAVAGAESGHIAVHPENPDLVYSGNYIGRIDRYDHRTRRSRNVILYPQMQDGVAPKDLKYRFQWNAPIVISVHDPEVVYHTSNYVHRTRDGGMTWETISPDLTTDQEWQQEIPGGPIQHDHTGVEVYNTIFAFAESALTAGELWAGSDDGLVHVSRDHGGSWADVTPRGMPEGGTVNVIEPSSHRPGRAYMAVYRYREDDWRPYIFRTDDWGRRWRLLTDGENGIPADHPVRVVREDPVREGLLYAGTEFGLFVSFDDGERWRSFRQNLPATPVTDLVVHRGDLVVATQGRSFWILDDLSVLRQLDAGSAEAIGQGGIHLFEPRDHYQLNLRGFRGDRAPEGPPAGAIIHFTAAGDQEVRLEIVNDAGEPVRVWSTEAGSGSGAGSARAASHGHSHGHAAAPGVWTREVEDLEVRDGINRFVWDLKVPGPEIVEGAIMSLGYTGGAWAPPGSYTVRLRSGEDLREERLVLRPDPRMPDVDVSGLEETFRLALAVRDKVTEVHDAIARLRSVREQVTEIAGRVAAERDGDWVAAVREHADTIAARLSRLEEELIQTRNVAGQDPLNFPPKLDNQLVYLYGHVNEAYGPPTEGAYERWRDLQGEVDPFLGRLGAILETEIPAFDAGLREHGVDGVIVPR